MKKRRPRAITSTYGVIRTAIRQFAAMGVRFDVDDLIEGRPELRKIGRASLSSTIRQMFEDGELKRTKVGRQGRKNHKQPVYRIADNSSAYGQT